MINKIKGGWRNSPSIYFEEKNGYIRFKEIPEWMWNLAAERVKDKKCKEKDRCDYVGELVEIFIQTILGEECKRVIANYDYDAKYKGLKLDAKGRTLNINPKPDLEFLIPVKNPLQQCDYYVCGSVDSHQKSGWLFGVVPSYIVHNENYTRILKKGESIGNIKKLDMDNHLLFLHQMRSFEHLDFVERFII